jgi:1-acyl-sn-glycerol-3-phosphate acyltransferase
MDRRFARPAYHVASLLARGWFRTEVRGLERIPRRGAALLVGNHALLGLDSVALFAEIARQCGRIPRGMAWRALFGVPGAGRLLRKVGAVPGTRDRAVALLEAGELVAAYPGGARESFKTAQERYRLFWDGRRGFAAAAARAGAPIIPVAAIGPDDAFRVIGREPFLGRRLVGVDLPLVAGPPVPRPVKFTFWVGEPIPAAPDDDTEALGARVQSALERLIAEGLVRRRSIWWG